MSPWLSALTTIGAVAGIAGAFALAALAPDAALWGALGLVVLLPLGYFLACTLIPGVEQKTCPTCGKDTLEPMDPQERYGVRCSACGFTDPDVPTSRLGIEPPGREARR